MLKKSGIGIILKQWDNERRKNFISVALAIQIPFEISAKAMCNARPDKDRTPTPRRIISPTVHSNPDITSMNGKPRLVREKNAILLLSKPALVCVRAQLTRFTRRRCAKTQSTYYGRRELSPPSGKRFGTVWADIRLSCVPWLSAALAVAVWKRLRSDCRWGSEYRGFGHAS